MTDNRRMTTDRFYGGVSKRLQNLQSMLEYVRDDRPPRDQLTDWVISNTKANSRDAVSHHLTFLDSIELIELSNTRCEISEYGQQWLTDQDPETLYDSLSSGVKGFDTILEALTDGPLTDEEIMDLLVSEFEEAEMSKVGPAIRHREWLQVLGFLEREGNQNRITTRGRKGIESKDLETSASPTTMHTPSVNISVGDTLSKEEIEERFDTGFGYQISGINPRRDDKDRRYVLVFANEDGPYNDSVTQGQFEYIGEGLSGDQDEMLC
jgi:putative restriction endonuclease